MKDTIKIVIVAVTFLFLSFVIWLAFFTVFAVGTAALQEQIEDLTTETSELSDMFEKETVELNEIKEEIKALQDFKSAVLHE